LFRWAQGQQQVAGIFCLRHPEQKELCLWPDNRWLPFQAAQGGEGVVEVGRYWLHTAAFREADDWLRGWEGRWPTWVVLDEVGKLELQGQGFADTVRWLLTQPIPNLILVVRDTLLEEVKEVFGLEEAKQWEESDMA
jgi:nucleoside-triphosphatase THEP1